jgi:pyruvate dehydrogenase E1 component beta subunit
MQTSVQTLTFAAAINRAMHEEMERDERVVVLGEDVARFGGVYKLTDGLYQRFGADRVFDTPISEAGIAGIGVGLAMAGMRPIVEIMFGDFITLSMDQMVNQAAKIHYMSGGKWFCPLVIRTTMGAGRRAAAQHSQSLHAWLAHVPGLKIAIPSTPADARGLLKTAIRDNNPVVFYEDKMMYRMEGPVPDEDLALPFGVADVKRPGDDITMIATSSMVQVALEAADRLREVGIEAEVIDPRTLTPLDTETLVRSAMKTSRCVVIDEGYEKFGVTAELASIVAHGAFYYLDAPVERIGAADVPVPFSPPLEDQTIPSAELVAERARALVGR